MRLSLALALVVLLAPATRAQTVDAAIIGSVRDSANVGLANTNVTAKNLETGVEWTVHTTSTGRFAFLQLPLGGPYTLTMRRIGYRSETRSGYQLTLGRRVVIDVVMGR